MRDGQIISDQRTNKPAPGVKTAAAKPVAAAMSLFHPKTIGDLTAHAVSGLLGLLRDDHGGGGSGTQRISEPRCTTTLVGCEW